MFGNYVNRYNPKETALWLRPIIEASGSVMVILDRQHRILEWNRAAEALHGCARAEALGRDYLDKYVDITERSALARDIDRVFSGAQVPEYESSLMTVGGDERMLLRSLIGLPGPGGQVDGVLVVGQDKHDSLRQANESEDGEGYAEALLASLPDGLSIIDSHGVHVDVNPAFCRMTGFSRDELVGTGAPHPYWPPEDLATIQAALEETLRNESTNLELTFMRKDGKRFPVLISPVAHRDSQGNVIGFFSTIKDMTEHKAGVESLRLSNRQLLRAEQLARIGSFSWKKETDEAVCSDSMSRILGLSPAEPTPNYCRFLGLLHPHDRDRFVREVEQALQRGDRLESDYRIIRPDTAEVRHLNVLGEVTWAGGRPDGVMGVVQDLTDSMLADVELRVSEERHRLVMEAATEGIWDWDCLTDRVHYSSFWKKILGRTEVTAEVSSWKSYLHPDERARVMSSLQEHLEGKTSHWKEEHRLLAADGSWKWVLGQGKVVTRTAEGAPMRMVGTMTDIGERKQFEEALRDSERILNQVGQMARIGGWEHDLGTGKARWTRALYDLVKLEPGSEPPGSEEHLSYYPPEDRRLLEEAYRRSVREQSSFDLELQARTTEGELRWFRAYGEPVLRDGKCVKMRGTFQDITDRKLAEMALRESEEKYRSLVDGADTGICLISPDMEILSLNRKIKEWFPHAEASKDRLCHAVFNHPPLDKPCSYCPVVKTFQTGQVHDAVTDTPTPDGIRHFRVVASPVLGSNNEVVSVIESVEDVTDKIIFDRELQKQAKLDTIGVLAGGIAHDFNNILAAITGNISLARLDCDGDSPIAEVLKDAADAADRAASLTQQLLTFSKGGSPVKRVMSLIDIVAESARFGLHGSNVKCELDMAPDLRLVDIDPGQISQVMNNLIINADQAMPHGGRITISARNVSLPQDDATVPLADGEYVQVKVIDEGDGIPEKHISRVFDPFFTTKEKGSGLGLSSCYSIVCNHGGFISVTSQQGIGSEFTVYIPSTRQTEATRPAIDDDVPKGDGRILVMDDEKMVRDLVSRVLAQQGYRVDTASDGTEAIEIYRAAYESAEPFDAVILDLTVPGGMGGYDTLQRLLLIDPEVVAIVSSGYSHDPVMAHAKEHQFAGCVSKPFNTVTLTRTVYNLLNRKAESNIDAV